MTVKEHRCRAHMHKEGESVLLRLGEEMVQGVVTVVGWQTGTYKVRVGHRVYFVSLTQVKGI
jgi:hypothetical protein